MAEGNNGVSGDGTFGHSSEVTDVNPVSGPLSEIADDAGPGGVGADIDKIVKRRIGENSGPDEYLGAHLGGTSERSEHLYLCVQGRASGTFRILSDEDRRKGSFDPEAVVGAVVCPYGLEAWAGSNQFTGRDIQVGEVSVLEESVEGRVHFVEDLSAARPKTKSRKPDVTTGTSFYMYSTYVWHEGSAGYREFLEGVKVSPGAERPDAGKFVGVFVSRLSRTPGAVSFFRHEATTACTKYDGVFVPLPEK